jgi:hypothetical protein
MLRHCRQDVQSKPVGLRHIAGHEVDARLHEPREEVDVAAETIEASDTEGRLVCPTGSQGSSELWPIVALA